MERPLGLMAVIFSFWPLILIIATIVYLKKIKTRVKLLEISQNELKKKLAETISFQKQFANIAVDKMSELIAENIMSKNANTSQYHQNEQSKLSEMKRLFRLLLDSGVSIYCWERHCYACKKTTKIYTYYLFCDIAKLDHSYDHRHGIGIGDIEALDIELCNRYETVKKCSNKHYQYANFCEHCGKIQGYNYIVDDPHEIIEDLITGNMDKYIVDTIDVKRTNFTINDLDFI